MQASERLAEIQARADQATAGPWEVDNDYDIMGRRPGLSPDPELDPVIGHLERDEDDDFVTHARTDVPALVAALRAVLDLHKPRDWHGKNICDACSETEDSLFMEYPCPTVRAVADALGAAL